ncbi:MAG: DUF1467 family protein [Pseudomonadota bacterium]
MSIGSAVVLFAVIWFMTLFVVLPLRLKTQGETGKVVPGTHSSAPAGPVMWRKVRIVTVVSAGLWVLCCAIILSGWITIRDIDFMERMSPQADETSG